MLGVHDIRETKVYQEALEEGLLKGIEQGIEKERQRVRRERVDAIAKLAAKKLPAAEIADILGVDLDLVEATIDQKR